MECRVVQYMNVAPVRTNSSYGERHTAVLLRRHVLIANDLRHDHKTACAAEFFHAAQGCRVSDNDAMNNGLFWRR